MADFGTDVSTWPDLDPTFAEISGPRVVAEAVLRRLQTLPGTIDDLPGEGIDLITLINGPANASRLRLIERRIQQEAELDERVLGASVTVSYTLSTGNLRADVVLETTEGPFELVLDISAVSVEVLSAETG